MSLALEDRVLPLERDEKGVVRVGGTRVTLDTIVSAYRQGSTPEQIADDYDSVSLPDIYSVISYYLRRRAEVDCYLEERRARGRQVRKEMEDRFDPHGVRERLLARRSTSQGAK